MLTTIISFRKLREHKNLYQCSWIHYYDKKTGADKLWPAFKIRAHCIVIEQGYICVHCFIAKIKYVNAFYIFVFKLKYWYLQSHKIWNECVYWQTEARKNKFTRIFIFFCKWLHPGCYSIRRIFIKVMVAIKFNLVLFQSLRIYCGSSHRVIWQKKKKDWIPSAKNKTINKKNLSYPFWTKFLGWGLLIN